MIEVTESIRLDEDELDFQFVRASGPGGQNVNKVATAVQLRFDLASSTRIPDAIKPRVRALAGRRCTVEGIIVLDARRYRTRERNRQDAIDRLVSLIQRAAEPQKKRVRSKPTQASKKRRLDEKKRRGEAKRQRRPVSGDDT